MSEDQGQAGGGVSDPWEENMARSLEKWGPKTNKRLRMVAIPINNGDVEDAIASVSALRLALAASERAGEEASVCIQIVRERVEAVLANWMRPPGGQQAGVPDKSISISMCRELLRTLTPEQGSYSYEEWCKMTDRLRAAESALATERAAHEETRRTRDEAKANVRLVHSSRADVWAWMGDGNDEPSSLTCPVIMSADTLRELLRERARAEGLAALLRDIRDAARADGCGCRGVCECHSEANLRVLCQWIVSRIDVALARPAAATEEKPNV